MKIHLTNDEIIDVPESTDYEVFAVYKDNTRVNICKEESGFRYNLYTIPLENLLYIDFENI